MFERNRIDTVDQGTTSVELTLTDGRQMSGKLTMPSGRGVLDFLNGAGAYVEFEPYDGDRAFIAKTSIRSVRVLQVPRPVNITQRLRDLDGFDPHSILGVERGAPWDVTRTAFHKLAKAYHPDRYATAELPDEVLSYLAGMARRVNAAYAVLEAAHADRRRYESLRQAPVYQTPSRA
jgi:hypothetical protein